MTPADRVAFGRAFYALSEAFSEPVSDLKTEAYFDALSDLAVETVLDAMRAAVRECRFFPRPVELRERITGNAQDRAELAWTGVLTLIRRVGWCGNPEGQWPDEAARRAALDLFGGWVQLCENLPGAGPELLGWAKRFTASYVAYAHRDGLKALPPLSRDEAKQLLAKIQSHRKALAASAVDEP